MKINTVTRNYINRLEELENENLVADAIKIIFGDKPIPDGDYIHFNVLPEISEVTITRAEVKKTPNTVQVDARLWVGGNELRVVGRDTNLLLCSFGKSTLRIVLTTQKI